MTDMQGYALGFILGIATGSMSYFLIPFTVRRAARSRQKKTL